MTTILIESLDLTEAQFDMQERVLRNVGLIKAGKSANRRFYSEDVLQKAIAVFEGAKAFDSHAKGERRVGELTGWYKNVRYENGALRADRHFLPTRAGQDVMAVVEAIKNGAPRNLAGLSINAVGTGKMSKLDGEDYLHVEGITAANSVDDVVNPAAGGSYIESVSGDEIAKGYVEALTFEEFFNARPDYIKRIQNEMKTARQDEAIKAAKAEADSRLTALNEAQERLTAIQQERDAAAANEATARRELMLEKAFRTAGLPAVTEKNLREDLASLPADQWLAAIARKKDELKALGLQKRVTVTGANQQIAQPVTATRQRDTLAEARQAIASASSPEELKRITEQLRM